MLAYQNFLTKEKSVLVITLGSAERAENSGFLPEALLEAIQTTGAAEAMTTEELRWYKIERFLHKNGTITNADVRQMFQVSAATANRILSRLNENGMIQKVRIGKLWGYKLK